MPFTPTDTNTPIPARDAMPWPALLRLIFATAMVFCTMAVITPTISDLVRERFGVQERGTSIFMIAHSLPQVLLLGLAVGLLSDRWGRRVPLAIIGGVGTAITTMLLPIIPNFNVLIGVRFIDGILGIAAVGMLMTRALDLGPPAMRPRVMGIYMTSIPIGYLCGSVLAWAVGLIEGAGLGVVYGIAGGGLLIASLLLGLDLPARENVAAREPGLSSMWRSLRGMPRLWLPILFGFVDKFSFALLAMLPALVLRDRYGVTGFAFAGAVMTSFWLAFLVTSAPIGRLTARWGAWRTVAAGSAGYGVCLILATAFGSQWAFLAFIAVAGVFTALQFVPNLVLVGQMARADEKATAISAFNLIGSFGLLAGLAFAGIVSGTLGYLATFAIVGAFEIACALLALWAASRIGSPAPISLNQSAAFSASPGEPITATPQSK